MSGGYVEAPVRTFQSGATIGAGIRVKLSAGVLAACGAEEIGIGTTEVASVSGDKVGVRLWNAQGTREMVAGGAITSGAVVFGLANGKIDDIANGNPIGIALEAASGNGSVIEVMPFNNYGLRTVGGEVTLDGTNPTPVTTGLDVIISATANQKTTSAPGDDPSAFTVDFTAGALSIYAWKNTGGTDPTLVASTNNSAVVCWMAVGY